VNSISSVVIRHRPGFTAARVTSSANRSAWQRTRMTQCTPSTVSRAACLQCIRRPRS